MVVKSFIDVHPRVGIIGSGSCIPPLRLTNKDLERMINTSDEWILSHVGIKERSIAPEHYNIYTMGAASALEAIEDAHLQVKDIDAIIVGHNYTDEFTVPSAACIIQHLIGTTNIKAEDISAGCSGGIYALDRAIDLMHTAYLSNKSKLNVLVGAVDKLSNVVDWKDRNTCILLSDSASFQVLNFFNDGGFLSSYTGADGSIGNTISYRSGYNSQLVNQNPIEFSNEQTTKRHYFKMDGRAVYKFAVRKMPEAMRKSWEAARFKQEDMNKLMKRLISHQANLYIIDSSGKRLGIDPEKIYTKGVKFLGNSSAASAGIGLDDEYKSNSLNEGDLVGLVVFGAGATWGSEVIEWNKRNGQAYKQEKQESLVDNLYKKYKIWSKDI